MQSGTKIQNKRKKAEKNIPTSIVLVFDPDFKHILMVKRVKNYFGFDWGYIAGKSDKGETAHETASREMWEEIGIRQYPQHIHSLSEYGIKSPPDPFTIFITSIPKEIPLTIKVDEIKEAKWFPIHNLPESRPMSEDAVIQSIISVVKSILLLPYRQNVQFWCYRKDGKILLLDESTTDEVYWKFPQGGIESNETHEKAITRELEEELNIKTFQILSKAKYINRYNWPPTLLVKGFRGQEQHIYLVYLPHPKEVKPNKKEGIRQAKWMTFHEAISHFLIPNQKLAADRIWKEFEPIIKRVAKPLL